MVKKIINKLKQHDFSKAKGALLSVLRICKIIAMVAVGLATVVVFFFVPFLHRCIDHAVAQGIWYVSFVILVLSCTIWGIRKEKSVFKTPIIEFLGKWGAFLVFPVVLSVFIFNYYDVDYIWMWVIFAMVALCVPIFFWSLLKFYIKHNKPSQKAAQKISLNTVKSVFLYWFIDLLYMSIFNDWLIFTFVFGILSLVIIFFNLTNAFLNGAKSLRFFIALELIIALALSGYLIFIIPNESIQEIVLTIVSALYGGMLTLVGVAWTIKRQDDIHQEQEIKAYRPIVLVQTNIPNETKVFKINKLNCDTITFEANKTNKISTYIQTIFLHNTDFAHFYLLGLIINEEKILIETKQYIHKDDAFAITFSRKILYSISDIDTVSLYVQDLLGNYYEIPLTYERIESDILERTYENESKPPIKIKDKITQIHVVDEQTAVETRSYE